MKKVELHVFCIWDYFQWSDDDKREVDNTLNKIGPNISFTALWDKKITEINLCRLYKSKKADRRKLELISNKKFLIVVVEESSLRYEYRQTTKCIKSVNSSILDAKIQLRKFSPNKFGIHSSDDFQESLENCWLLFGVNAQNKSIKDFQPKSCLFKSSGKTHNQTIGLYSWDSFEELYMTLSICDSSIVVNKRGASLALNLKEAINDKTCDIDLLSKDRELTKKMLGLITTKREPHEFIVKINNQNQRIDIRDWKDGYFNPVLAAEAFRSRSIAIGNSPICSDLKTMRHLLLYNLVINKKFKDFNQYIKLVNMIGAHTHEMEINTERSAKIELSRILDVNKYWIPRFENTINSIQVNPKDNNTSQYKIDEEESRTLQVKIRNRFTSLKQLKNLSKTRFEYNEGFKREYECQIYKVDAQLIGNNIPLCLRVVKPINQNIYERLSKTRHRILDAIKSEYIPNLIAYECSDEDKVVVILTQWLRGDLLSKILKTETLTKKLKYSLCMHIETYLEQLKSNNYFHGGIVEKNIIVHNSKPYFLNFINSKSISESMIEKDRNSYFDRDRESATRLQKIILEDNIT